MQFLHVLMPYFISTILWRTIRFGFFFIQRQKTKHKKKKDNMEMTAKIYMAIRMSGCKEFYRQDWKTESFDHLQ